MTETQIKHFENKLLDEKALLEKELSEVAEKNPTNPTDWVPTIGDKDQSQADDNQTSDSFENLENNIGVTTQLENRLNDIKDALAKIATGTYGMCEVDNHAIEIERLEVNPAARTCKIHMK
ncbi:MAG: hypothetical protein WA051_01525 [Minisyncoccia bacterium]